MHKRLHGALQSRISSHQQALRSGRHGSKYGGSVAIFVDLNFWKNLIDPSTMQWKIIDPKEFVPILKPIEGLDAPSLIVPTPAAI